MLFHVSPLLLLDLNLVSNQHCTNKYSANKIPDQQFLASKNILKEMHEFKTSSTPDVRKLCSWRISHVVSFDFRLRNWHSVRLFWFQQTLIFDPPLPKTRDQCCRNEGRIGQAPWLKAWSCVKTPFLDVLHMLYKLWTQDSRAAC